MARIFEYHGVWWVWAYGSKRTEAASEREATAFCQRRGFDYKILPSRTPKRLPRSYP